ncbi:dystrobrevin beta-like [Uloborus diversus]|uniref:dystrobrevin beta-like n=1 Tax=Uloborus diversus TaxID=327109 RepID=UPI00240A09ED|nr:dystrobrevin beta-like [Uloborus diversus]
MDRSHHHKEKTAHTQSLRSDYHYLMAEMKAQNYDVIKFATYRTASKLRFIQKKTNMNLLDIWNIIEAFRENGLNALDSRLELTIARLETLVRSIYSQLNKRLPVSQQIDVDYSSSVLVNWLLATYDQEDTGKVRVFSIKIALAIICAGKITDKLRYIFSLISDVNGNLVFSKFVDFLKEAMGLPCSVYESPSFFFTDSLPRTIFDGQSTVTVNDFLDVLLSDPGPQCLMWFPLIHRMASVENVLHNVQCEGCNKDSFTGFRYKCQRCYNYQLCQDCFWRCRVSGNHTNQHEMKEYTSYKTPSKQLGHSLKKSILCVPDKPAHLESHYHDEPVRNTNPAFDITHRRSSSDFYPRDEEHSLISQYSNHLYANRKGRYSSELNLPSDTARQRELIAKLEAKNREIMREIIRLRKQQEEEDEALRSERNPTLLAELRALRLRKADLERHLSSLQESRRDLVLQLDVLMRMLKDHSPLSSPNSSPHSLISRYSPVHLYPLSSVSAPATPGSGCPYTDPLLGLGGDVRLAFGPAASSRSLQNDLLVAADSVTNAMSSLVKELNLGEGDDIYARRHTVCVPTMGPQYDYSFENESWHNVANGPEYRSGYQKSYLLDPGNDIYRDGREIYPGEGPLLEDSFLRSDEEDNWEDGTRRWSDSAGTGRVVDLKMTDFDSRNL